MKTSNVLLISLLSFVFLAMIGVNISIKNKLDKIDLNDQYSGYSRHPLEPFKHIKLKGQPFGVIRIQPGESFEIRKEEKDFVGQNMILEWRQNGDTLVVSQRMKEGARVIPYTPDGYVFRQPHLYILAPTVSSLRSEGITSVLSNWTADSIFIEHTGKGLLLSNNRFDGVTIYASKGSYVGIGENNHLNNATIMVLDSSELGVEKDVFGKLSMRADSNAVITFPGGLLRKNLKL